MISNEKIRLLRVWEKNPFSEMSIGEVMKLSKKKTKTWVFNSLNYLVEKRLLLSDKKANLNLYRLNLSNPFLIQIMQYLEAQEHLDFTKKDIVSEIIENNPLKNCSIIVFGSYADNKQKTDSDLDICILIKTKREEKIIKPYINEAKLNHLVDIDAHYITYAEFTRMLLRREENLGKQIFRKHLIFYNPDIYYKLIKEAYMHGFRP